jgi:hypothetical protein
MNTELRFNICELESSHIRNRDVTDLSTRIATFIPFRLSYSCRFWAAHLCDTTNGLDVRPCPLLVRGHELDRGDFGSVRCITYCGSASSSESDVLLAHLEVLTLVLQSFRADLSDFARDASRFIVVNFHTPISEIVPHIYLHFHLRHRIH